jgi:hypothetical protein
MVMTDQVNSLGGHPHLDELVEELQRRAEEAELAAAVQVDIIKF